MDRTDPGLEEGLRSREFSPARDGADPGRTGYTGYDVSAMIDDRHDSSCAPGVSTASATSRIPSAVVLPNDRDGGAGRTDPLSYCCLVPLPGRWTVRRSVAGPGGLVESGPELDTELSRPHAGVHGIPWQQGRHPKSKAFAPNSND